MDYLLVILVAFAASGLTLFSGFGLGTILMPAFALIFPVPTAIAVTAIVHLANNVFKVGLIARHAAWSVVLQFALPAALAAVLGAAAMVMFASMPVLARYELAGRMHDVTALKLVIGLLIAGFALLDLSGKLEALAVPPKYLALGGLLSGFFGGLSGNQGAFRSAFLIKAGLDKEAFVATGVVSAVIVDMVRIAVYGVSYATSAFEALPDSAVSLVLAATLSAFTGAWLGVRLLEKVTLGVVKTVVALAMAVIGLGLAGGLI